MKVTLEGNAEDIRKVLGAQIDESDVKVTYERDGQHTFKVDEKARLIKLSETTYGFSEGEVVRIVDNRISPDQGRVAFSKLNNDSETGFANPDQLNNIAPLTRREIVKKAKADVAYIIAKAKGSKRNHDGNYTFREKTNTVKFDVIRKSRIVVALVSGKYTGGLREKGIAKAAPDDVFNAHIGKAIALRRALGLAVPDEYLHAPKPEGIEVGDKVQSNLIERIYTVKSFIDNPQPSKYPGIAFRTIESVGWLASSQVTVIDDSDRNYDVAE
jgi:hypothetical protein